MPEPSRGVRVYLTRATTEVSVDLGRLLRVTLEGMCDWEDSEILRELIFGSGGGALWLTRVPSSAPPAPPIPREIEQQQLARRIILEE